MTAHLHRYGSELALLTETVHEIAEFHNRFHQIFEDQGLTSAKSYETVCQGIGLITTHLLSISRFRNELQLKTDNVLALVGLQGSLESSSALNSRFQLVDNTQVTNDRLLVENSKAMQEILQATQQEAKQSRAMASQSQQMAEEMNKILEATRAETKASRRVALQSQRLTEEMKKDSVAMKTVH